MTPMSRNLHHQPQLPLLFAVTVWATIAMTPTSAHARSDFWDELANPGNKVYQAELARGLKLERQAVSLRRRTRLPHLVTRVYNDAVAAFRRAIKARPEGAAAHLALGRILLRLERYPAGMAAVNAARRLDSRLRDDTTVAFEMGVAYSKLGKFQAAVDEYDLYERVRGSGRVSSSERATAHANAAEALMALGRLDEAIQRYRSALAYGSSPLTYWGLAVALDRDEQVSRAMDAVKLAMRAGMRTLTLPSVFFIPKGDVHYYFALGHLSEGKLDKAREAFQRFLQEVPKSQWAFRARAHLAELGKPVAHRIGKQKKRLAPMPSPQAGLGDALERDRRNYRSGIRSSYYTLQRCYSGALRHDKKLAGKMRVQLVVGLRGRPTSVKVVYSSVRNAKLKACVVQALKSRYLGRPVSKKPVKLTIPVEFKAN